MKCNNCGKEVTNDSVFCEFCGKKVSVSSDETIIDEKGHETGKQVVLPKNKGKSKKKVVWLVLVGVVIIVVSVAFLLSNIGNRIIRAEDFHNGIAPVVFDSKDGLRQGFIDKTGRIICRLPDYYYIHGLTEGIDENLFTFRVGDDEQGKYGFVDFSGRIAISPKYDFADSFYEGLAMVKANGK